MQHILFTGNFQIKKVICKEQKLLLALSKVEEGDEFDGFKVLNRVVNPEEQMDGQLLNLQIIRIFGNGVISGLIILASKLKLHQF